MPYRGLERRHEDSLDLAELDAMAREAKKRRRRAAFTIGTLVVGAMSAIVSAAAWNRATAKVEHCHHVEVAYENARQLPHDRWRVCDSDVGYRRTD